jgi:hypothetical protein
MKLESKVSLDWELGACGCQIMYENISCCHASENPQCLPWHCFCTQICMFAFHSWNDFVTVILLMYVKPTLLAVFCCRSRLFLRYDMIRTWHWWSWAVLF